MQNGFNIKEIDMKKFAMNFLEGFFEQLFSFGMFIFILCIGFVLLIGGMLVEETKRKELTQLRTEACYAQGMVLVVSDAGQRCVAPANLVKVK
jgi:hypothetical protein